MKKIFIKTFILVSFCNVYSQDTNIVKYLPLNVGNVWVYDRQQPPYVPPGPGKDYLTIEGTSVINNHLFYSMRTITYNSIGGIVYNISSYIRIDSMTGNVYSSSCLIDSLYTKKNDSALVTCENRWMRCIDTSTYSIFGQTPKSKSFFWSNYFEVGGGRVYAKNFGKVYNYNLCPTCSQYWYLRGCIINGVLYGDTTLTGINQFSSKIPDKFSLSQNYPNPFNPTTSIKFDIPKAGNVSFKIYDIAGKEIYSVNEFKSAGQYAFTFDVSNYATGVYFYKLESGTFTETKKMVLIK